MPKNHQLSVNDALRKTLKEQSKLISALEKTLKAGDKKKAVKIKAQIKYAGQIIDGLTKQLPTARARDKKEILDMFNL